MFVAKDLANRSSDMVLLLIGVGKVFNYFSRGYPHPPNKKLPFPQKIFCLYFKKTQIESRDEVNFPHPTLSAPRGF